MGLPGRPSLARVLLLSLVLSGLLPLWPHAALAGAASAGAEAGAVDTRRTPPPGSAPLPVRGPMAAGAGSFVPGRVLVAFEPGAGERGRRTAAAAVDGQVAAGTGPTRVVELDRGADVRAAARRLAARPDVAFAEPDWIRRIDACDPAVCWHLQPRPGADVVAAHAGGHRGAGRTVAVVDTGVATGVADLTGQVAERWRCSNTGCAPSDAAPTSSHGTEVASVVAALDEGADTTGVTPGATVVSYRVDGAGGIPISYLYQALARIAADHDVDVVNLSLGGSQWSQTEQDDVKALLATGKVVVAAAGNTGDRVPQYPAAFPGVLSVGATAAPNPFEPRPHDGDRDTTVFAMTSSEPGRLRVVISRADGGVVRVLESDSQKAGRQRLGWTGRTAAGAWLRGRFTYVIEATDAAGNTARSGRHGVRVL